MKRKMLVLMTFVGMMTGMSSAQSTFTLKTGISLPQAKFGKGDIYHWGLANEGKRGGAGTGFSIGVECVKAFTDVEGLGVSFSVDAIYNGLNGDFKDAIDELAETVYGGDNDIIDYTIYTQKYINIPLVLGLNYIYALNGNLSIFGNAGIGANVRIITPFVEEYEYGYDSRGVEGKNICYYQPSLTLSWRICSGVSINNMLSISLDYYVLGESKVEGEAVQKFSDNTRSSDFTFGKINPTVLLIRLGFYL